MKARRCVGALTIAAATLLAFASCQPPALPEAAPAREPKKLAPNETRSAPTSLAEVTARTLPSVRSGAPLTAPSMSVVITKSEVRIDDQSVLRLPARGVWERGFDAQFKTDGARSLYLVPVAGE
jgi:hypothetical protein